MGNPTYDRPLKGGSLRKRCRTVRVTVGATTVRLLPPNPSRSAVYITPFKSAIGDAFDATMSIAFGEPATMLNGIVMVISAATAFNPAAAQFAWLNPVMPLVLLRSQLGDDIAGDINAIAVLNNVPNITVNCTEVFETVE